MDDTHPLRSAVVGIDGSQAAIRAALWPVDEALSREVPLRLIHVTHNQIEPARRPGRRPMSTRSSPGGHAEQPGRGGRTTGRRRQTCCGPQQSCGRGGTVVVAHRWTQTDGRLGPSPFSIDYRPSAAGTFAPGSPGAPAGSSMLITRVSSPILLAQPFTPKEPHGRLAQTTRLHRHHVDTEVSRCREGRNRGRRRQGTFVVDKVHEDLASSARLRPNLIPLTQNRCRRFLAARAAGGHADLAA